MICHSARYDVKSTSLLNALCSYGHAFRRLRSISRKTMLRVDEGLYEDIRLTKLRGTILRAER